MNPGRLDRKKERNRKKGKGRAGQNRALPSVWDSSPSAWQAADGVAWSASHWRGAEGADVTRERATSVAEVTPPSFTGLSFHTSRFMNDPTCPPIIYIMVICTILFFCMLLINVCYLMWCYWERKSSVARLRDLSFRRQEAVEADEVEQEVLITFFFAEVRVSPNGKRYHTSSSCDALRLNTSILKGICRYCKTRESAPVAGSAEM